jgi:hypothetical protein
MERNVNRYAELQIDNKNSVTDRLRPSGELPLANDCGEAASNEYFDVYLADGVKLDANDPSGRKIRSTTVAV